MKPVTGWSAQRKTKNHSVRTVSRCLATGSKTLLGVNAEGQIYRFIFNKLTLVECLTFRLWPVICLKDQRRKAMPSQLHQSAAYRIILPLSQVSLLSFPPLTHSVIYSISSSAAILYSVVFVFCVLLHRRTRGEQCDCEYLWAAPARSFCSSFILIFDPVLTLRLHCSRCSGCSQTCPLTFPLFLSFWSVYMFLFVCVCVCDCRLGLGRLRPPCWTWLNVLITGSGTPMKSVSAWKGGNKSRSASYRYCSVMVWMCMAPWMLSRKQTLLGVFASHVRHACVLQFLSSF